MRMYLQAKRAFDFLIAMIIGILVLPIVIIVAIALWLVQRQVLFRQVRPGLRQRPFVLYKFCSMNEARDHQGALLPDSERLTGIGSFVRNSSLDELPQLWNVLRGDMSMVGPRPLLMEYLPRYTPEQMRRHVVKPGITGWAQVNGRNALSWEDKFSLDLWYVENASFLLDLKILVMTAWQVLKREGISNDGHSTMPEFHGTRDPATESIPKG